MAAITDVTLTAGVPTAGTGTVTTLDKFNGTAGASTTQALTVQGITSGTAMPVSLASVPSHAVTNIGTFAVQAVLGTETTKVIGVAKIGDGTSLAAVKAASTAPVATDPALVVSISPNSVNANGIKNFAGSAPVVSASLQYETVAASATDQILGATGGVGDYIDGLLCIVSTAATSQVQIKDGNGSAITVLPNSVGAGIGSYYVPLGLITVNATTPGWKITTAAGVAVIGTGNFT